MTEKFLESHENGGKNETSRGDVGASSPALDIDTWIGGDDMPVDRHYGDSTPQNNPEHSDNLWRNAYGFKRSLVSEGWKTPNTYDNCFAVPVDGPAVYLFLLHGWDERDGFDDFETAMVGYVGMSRRLKRRLEKHPVLREIEKSDRYIQKWFRPTRPDDLRADEHSLIQRFDPPWNIQGRKRGVALI